MGKAVQKTDLNDSFYFERTQRNHYFLGGKESQKELRKLKIGIAGLGGMGSNIAEYFARLGVGELKIADPDTIDISNINRQVIANTNSVGTKKATASCSEISVIAPDTNILVFDEGITEDTVREFVDGCDFVVDEIDVFPLGAHYLLHKVCREYNIPIYSAYVVGLGVHFYKFQGDEFKFEDFLKYSPEMSNAEIFEEVADKLASPLPEYLKDDNLLHFKKTAIDTGVPIFGPSCLIGHSIVVTRILCDFLGSKVLGVKIPDTPVMPEFLKIDFSTLEIRKEKFSK